MVSKRLENKNETELRMSPSNVNETDNGIKDQMEGQEEEKKLKYPKSVFFIISNELCERFAYYGMRTILAIYLQKKLKYDENTATVIFHTFVMLCYFFPVVGAIIADSYLGKFRTIVYLTVVYTIGDIVLAVASASIISIPHRALSILGLVLIAAGTGGIKPCVSAFGGDQFIVPQQERQLQQFFSVFYFSINIGSVLGTFISPILRQDIHCLGENSCFPLAFAVPAFCMVIALTIFIAGKSRYKIKQPQGNVIVDVSKCICYALKRKFSTETNKTKQKHWLDYANNKYDRKLIEDIKIVLSIALMLSPTIIFWALFEQQGSSWTFQASRMDGNLWEGVDIKPDQIHIINPFLVLLLIPLFQKHLYPLLSKLHILRTPLQKMSFGGMLAASSFLISGFLELQLQPTYAVLPKSGEAQLRIFNSYNCSIQLQTEDGLTNLIGPLDLLELKSLPVNNITNLRGTMTINKKYCSYLKNDLMWSEYFTITEKQATSYLVYGTNAKMSVRSGGFDDIDKSDYGKPKLRIMYSIKETTYVSLQRNIDQESSVYALLNASDIAIPDVIIPSGKYTLKLNGSEIDSSLQLLYGAVYRLMVVEMEGKYIYKLFTLTPPNSVHMLWILPQLIVITVAEMFFSITGLEFTFMQAPNSMKSVTSSIWLLTTSLGNLVVVFISELLHSDNRAITFFSYSGLMVLVMAVFIFLAMRYKYVQIVTEESDNKTNGRANEGFTPDSN